jgi:hypothetical protein
MLIYTLSTSASWMRRIPNPAGKRNHKIEEA